MVRNHRFIPLLAIVTACLPLTVLAAQRVVLFEEQTSETCLPCTEQNPIILATLEPYGSQVATVKWHVWWPSPGNDRWYLHNNLVSRWRVEFYNFSPERPSAFAPDIIVDGRARPSPSSPTDIRNQIDARLADPSPIAITGTAGMTETDVHLSLDVTVETAKSSPSLRLYTVLIEKQCLGVSPNSPNGEVVHHNVMRRINNNDATHRGQPIDLSNLGTQHFNITLPLHASYARDQIHAVAWVQDTTDADDIPALSEVLQAAEFVPTEVTVGVSPGTANQAGLQSHPNPFNFASGTAVEFTLETAGDVRLAIYDVTGKRVRDLVRGWKAVGRHSIRWDGRDAAGLRPASGLYFCHLDAAGLRSTSKLLLID